MFPVRTPTSFPSNVCKFCRNCQASELADEHRTGKIQVKEALATTKKLIGADNSIKMISSRKNVIKNGHYNVIKNGHHLSYKGPYT